MRVRVPPAVVRQGVRQLGRRVLDPDLPWEVQRRRLDRLMGASPVPRGTVVGCRDLAGVRASVMGSGTSVTVVHFHTSPENWESPLVSPVLGSHSGLPPLLVQAGCDELLAPDASRLAVSASAAGADVTYSRWPGMWHDFALQPGVLAAADSALAQAVWFVETVTGIEGSRFHSP